MQHWIAAVGTITNVESAFGRHEHRYTIDAERAGVRISRTIKHKDRVEYQAGTQVRIEISDDGDIRFDPNYEGDASIVPAQIPDYAFTTATARVTGPDGREIDFYPDEVASLFEAIIEGDEATRATAEARLAEIEGSAAPASSGGSEPTTEESIEFLQQMVNEGILSQEEFDAERRKLMGG
jgi:hypothetical protein